MNKQPKTAGMGWEGKRMSEFGKITMAYAFWDPQYVLTVHECWRYEGIMN